MSSTSLFCSVVHFVGPSSPINVLVPGNIPVVSIVFRDYATDIPRYEWLVSEFSVATVFCKCLGVFCHAT